MVRIELYDLLGKTQEYIAKYYATALTDEQKHDQLKSYIEKYILDGGFIVHGFTEDKLIDRLYAEMVEYSKTCFFQLYSPTASSIASQ